MAPLTAEDLDRLLYDVRDGIDLYGSVTPTNVEQAEQQFRTNGEAPQFEYEPVHAGPAQQRLDTAAQQLDQGYVDDSIPYALLDLYRRTLEDYQAQADIVANMDKPAVVEERTAAVFGTPDKATVEEAYRLLEQDADTVPDDARYTAEEMHDRLQTVSDKTGLGWDVVPTENGIVSVRPEKEQLLAPADRQYTANEFIRLPLHELGGHGMRAANGFAQGYDLLGLGAAQYMEVEEGITTFIEEQAGVQNPETLETYAARVVAVDDRLNRDGQDFRYTYTKLRDHGLDHDTAFTTTMRAYRPLPKDHVYLQGLLTVRSFFQEDDNTLQDLYRGRTTIEDAGKLQEADILSEPVNSPVQVALAMDQDQMAERLERIW